MIIDISIYCSQIMSVSMHYFKVILKNFKFDELTFLPGVKHIKCYNLALMLCAGYIFFAYSKQIINQFFKNSFGFFFNQRMAEHIVLLNF